MANDVFANGREISCKAGSGKSICAFPDVCFTPPENPATPPGVPVPYPNTGMDGDATDGSRTVLISGKEIMLKNKSYYKKSLGDEAGCAAKKGVVTSVNRGKVYFISWSMNVKCEGENVVRHLDLTTHNHASPVANSPPIAHVDEAYIPHQQDARVEGKHRCECCGGAAHSAAQARGDYMTEEVFYNTANNPQNAALLRRVRSDPQCRHLLPKPGRGPCTKYYRTEPTEQRRIENDWSDHNSARYRRFAGVPPGTQVAHKVPKAAGGCPAGQGNLAPTGRKCKRLEDQLSTMQERAINRLRG